MFAKRNTLNWIQLFLTDFQYGSNCNFLTIFGTLTVFIKNLSNFIYQTPIAISIPYIFKSETSLLSEIYSKVLERQEYWTNQNSIVLLPREDFTAYVVSE